MSRKSTTIWIIGAVVVVGAGVTVAGISFAPSTGHVTSTPTSVPVAGGTATPDATATNAPSGAASDPASPSSAPVSSSPPAATTPPPVTVAKVTPSMSYWAYKGDTLTLGGGVSGLVDAGGVCTVTVTRGSATVSQTFHASPGPSSTDCGAMSITSSKFTAGTWNLTISYSSAHAKGTSAVNQVTL